ncbi:MAG: hypothetical protein B6245_21955 [Desulfobacteraceae bacterium 4572_88]|nr:MAG: hypothetical protein B6245_21955 [Desulfobacteraceae bacterium 4572_88]
MPAVRRTAQIICRRSPVPHVSEKAQEKACQRDISFIFQEIADTGGLDIRNPQEWQREIRKDRYLPFRRT